MTYPLLMKSIFHYLRKVRWLYHLNTIFKCAKDKRKYRTTVEYYSHVQISDYPVWPNFPRKDRYRVFFMGTDEQQDKSGLVQALQRNSDLRCFTRADGGWGQNDPTSYEVRRIRNTNHLWLTFSENAKLGWIPDILLTQTWACLIDPAILSRIRDTFGSVICNISMDDRHQYWGTKVRGVWDGTYSLIPHIDLALTAAPEAVEWYEKEGCAAIYFPEASDDSLFHPMPSTDKIYDVCFVGSRYGIRGQIVAALRNEGINVATYGSGWEGGRIDSAHVPTLFAKSRIVLGVSSIGHCPDFVGLKLRDFDGPMSGSCYLTQHNDDLIDLYEIGKEILTYRDKSDCINQVKFLLANNGLRETIASRGRKRALQDHTWDKRFSNLFIQFNRS